LTGMQDSEGMVCFKMSSSLATMSWINFLKYIKKIIKNMKNFLIELLNLV
jgi:hypothetical protein